jgi:hypothetical protein
MSKWARQVNEADYAISEENAEKAVRELLDFYEVDTTRDTPEQDKVIDRNLDDLAKAYRLGELENKKDDTLGFCVVQHRRDGSAITYRELGGKDRICMEGLGDNNFSRIYAILGKLSGYGDDAIAKLKDRDWQVASTLALVFTMASFG